MKHYIRLSYSDRQVIEQMLNSGVSVDKIAIHLNRHRSSIYREISLGKKDGKYSAEVAQEYALMQQKEKGRPTLLEANPNLCKYISRLILEDKLSPAKIVQKLKDEGYSYPSAYHTIYSAIDNGLIPNVTREAMRDKRTHMFSDGLIRLPLWVRKELELKNNEDLIIDIVDGKIVVEKSK